MFKTCNLSGLLFTGLFLVTMIIGCNSEEPDVENGQVARSAKQRDTSPDVTEQEQAQLVAGRNALAVDLYRQLREDKENIFFSPHSISIALAMTYAGAREETEQQMSQALHFPIPQDRLHPAMNWLALQLAERGKRAENEEKPFRLNIVNAIWAQEDYQLLPSYLDLLAVNYDAGVRLMDFQQQPEQARQTINEWVSRQTEERIKDLLPERSITELTRLVLTNAIYFNASWAYPFDRDRTQKGPFHLLDSSQVEVPMMRQTETFPYAQGEGYQALELPYQGWELSMIVLLPRTDNFTEFEESLTQERLSSIIGELRSNRVALVMPKFETQSEFDLQQTLSVLGMPAAFTEDANFSGIDGTENLLISTAVHQAFVSVDEKGTEAAAATAIGIGVTAFPTDPPVDFIMDRPFVFLIRDNATGTILFLGRILNPAS